MKKLSFAIILGMIALLTLLIEQPKIGFFTTIAQQTEQIPEPDLSAFPLPIRKVSVKKIADYPIDSQLTNFKSLKQHIDTTILLIGDHIFFANDKTVYRLTNGIKRTLVFDAPLYKVITDWKSRVFVMTKTRWVYVYDLNSLKRLSSFQVKYAQNPSEFAYLSDDVLLIGFDLWKDQARKNRNPVAAVAFGMNGVERWKIQNTAKIFSNFDERFVFEILQIGRRSFVANCCSFPVQKTTYEQNVKTGFLYENKTGLLRISEIKTPDSVLTMPIYLNIDNLDLFTYHESTTLDMYNYKNLPIVSLGELINNKELSKILPTCDFIGLEDRRLIYENYIIFSAFGRCGSKIGFLNMKSKNLLNYSRDESCMYNSPQDGREDDISLIKNKNLSFFIDSFTRSIAKINLNNQIDLKCVFSSTPRGKKEVDYSFRSEYKILTRMYSDDSSTVNIGNLHQITLGIEVDSKEILQTDGKFLILKNKFAIGAPQGEGWQYYEVIK